MPYVTHLFIKKTADSAHTTRLHNLLCTQKDNDGKDRYSAVPQYKFHWMLTIIHIKIEECFDNGRMEYIRESNNKKRDSLWDEKRPEQVVFKLKWKRWIGVDQKGWYWWYLIWDIRKLENILGKGSQSLDNRYSMSHVPVTMVAWQIIAKFSDINNYLLYSHICESAKFDLCIWQSMLAVDFGLQSLCTWDVGHSM